MGRIADTFTAAQWAQLLVGGGLAGVATSLISTRIEWRRLRSEEAERTSFYEQRLFEARLEAYRGVAATMAELMDAAQGAIDPYREAEAWDDAAHRALFSGTTDQRANLYRQLLCNALLFGVSVDDVMGDWTSMLNLLIGSAEGPGKTPNDDFMLFGVLHYRVLQAMRADLHLGTFDASLFEKVAKAR